jgi:tyrosine-protein phosphatase YwqE
MFSIFKKKSSSRIDYSAVGVDMHSHLLPGIDDGSAAVEDSLAFMKGLQELGFKKFITTPHIMADLYPNTPATIQAAFDKLKQAGGNDLPLRPAAEYMLDDSFAVLLNQGVQLRCIHENTVLVEFSFVTAPLDFKEKFFNLQMSGYQPLLAHPERYLYLSGNKTVYDELKSAGCQFAVNLLSFTGYYGKGSTELAQYLFKKDYIDYLGTDLHHQRHLDALRQAHAVMPVIQKLADSGKLMNAKL